MEIRDTMKNRHWLRKLLLTGNLLRTLRSSLVSGPTAALLRYLRGRLSEGDDSEAIAPVKEEVISKAARLSISSKELSLQGMGLNAVPSEVYELGTEALLQFTFIYPNVRTLILPETRLKNGQIPLDGFQAVSKLQVLDLSGNPSVLPECPAFLSIPDLQELYLRGIQLHEVPSEILCLQQLQILDLSQSQNSLQSHLRNFSVILFHYGVIDEWKYYDCYDQVIHVAAPRWFAKRFLHH